MRRFLLPAEGILRGAAPPGGAGGMLRHLVALVLVCGAFYGGIMGCSAGLAGERIWQVVFSALKVPLLLLATFLIALPSFFVLNTLLGVRGDFPAVLRALLASQAGLAIVLAGLAPYTVLWYVSSADYPAAILFNGVMFAVAAGAGQWILRRAYRPLVQRSGVHHGLLWTWIVLYAFVGIQMAWILRPFVGHPAMRTRFFREDTWGNAYLKVAKMLWDALAI